MQPPASLDEARQYVGRTVIKYFEPVPALNYPGGHAAGTVASAQVHMSQPGGQTQLQHSDPTQFYFLVKWVGERVVWGRQCGRQRGDDVGAPSNLCLQQPGAKQCKRHIVMDRWLPVTLPPGVARPTAVALSNTRTAPAHDMPAALVRVSYPALYRYGDSYEEHIPWEQLAHILMPIQPDVSVTATCHEGFVEHEARRQGRVCQSKPQVRLRQKRR